jgi:hypothetical protein
MDRVHRCLRCDGTVLAAVSLYGSHVAKDRNINKRERRNDLRERIDRAIGWATTENRWAVTAAA